MPFNLTQAELNFALQFKRDYHYLYEFGNDTVVRLSNQEVFRYLEMLFDSKIHAQEMDLSQFSNSTFFPYLKYHMMSGHEQTLVGLIRALNIDISEVPTFGSSIMFEFYRYQGTDEKS